MSRVLRAQLSLNFSDESVYDGLVIPLKQNRELNATVERLLSSYFYNEQVRSLVDGFDAGEAKSLMSEIDAKRNEAFKSAKETLAMMSMLSASARSTMEDGIEDIISHINSDDSTAFADSTYSPPDTMKSIPQIIRQHASLELTSGESEKPKDEPAVRVEDDSVNETLKRHDDTLKLLQESIGTVLSSVNLLSGKVEDLVKTQSLNQSNEVVTESDFNSGVSEIAVIDTPVNEPSNDQGARVEVVDVMPSPDSEPSVLSENVSSEEKEVGVDSVEDIINPPEVEEERIDGSDILRSFLSDGIGVTKFI